jgi:hypothetical protein
VKQQKVGIAMNAERSWQPERSPHFKNHKQAKYVQGKIKRFGKEGGDAP